MAGLARDLTVVVRFQDENEILNVKIDLKKSFPNLLEYEKFDYYRELFVAIIRLSSIRTGIEDIYVYDEHDQKVSLKDTHDVKKVVENKYLYPAVYVEPYNVPLPLTTRSAHVDNVVTRDTNVAKQGWERPVAQNTGLPANSSTQSAEDDLLRATILAPLLNPDHNLDDWSDESC